MSKFEFNLEDSRDVSMALKVLQAIKPDAFNQSTAEKSESNASEQAYSSTHELVKRNTDLSSQIQSLENQIKEKDASIKELNETIKVAKRNASSEASSHEQELQIRDQTIDNLNSKIEELREKLSESEAKVKESETLLELTETEHKQAMSKLQEDNNKQVSNLSKRNNELENRIESLTKKLQAYDPDLGAKVGEEMTYQIDETASQPTLTQTMSDDAPYIVQKNENGTVSFKFNYEKGKAKTAIANRETWLEPFCEIEEVPGANAIRLAGVGIAELNASGDINVIKQKAKIKLVKL